MDRRNPDGKSNLPGLPAIAIESIFLLIDVDALIERSFSD